MKTVFLLLMHLLATVAKCLGPGGAKALLAENLLLKQQLLIVSRSRQRAPNLSAVDRFLLGVRQMVRIRLQMLTMYMELT
ncbi:MAG: hypothetical protein OEU36_11750 [Gammaproteobacteria bacterium]|jgi:hypothetical protein|nr:hypothetical protein [Gammaproteobacteria bacterium]